MHETPAEVILQPGLACLTEGLNRLEELRYSPESAS